MLTYGWIKSKNKLKMDFSIEPFPLFGCLTYENRFMMLG